ncbi:MAG: hypothetical protein JNJ63_01230 [Hyphomonadaceae bacterium]|nr:hypothetical protein [Hyphomonadaceae bacterium]
MIDVLLALHLIGLMMGAGGGFGSMITMQEAAKRPPEQAGVMKSLGPVMARFSATGLALMWLTGLSLVFVKFGGFSDLPPLFWAKMAFVTALTVCSILAHITYGQVKAGNVAAAKRLPVLGPLSGASSLVAVVFAVLSFH